MTRPAERWSAARLELAAGRERVRRARQLLDEEERENPGRPTTARLRQAVDGLDVELDGAEAAVLAVERGDGSLRQHTGDRSLS